MAMPSREETEFIETGERLKAMMHQERSHYLVPDYLSPEWQLQLRAGTEPAALSPSSSSSGSNTQITEEWRNKISEWCYQVVDHFDFNREVVSVAMSYLDRYLATRTVNRRIFQLAAMTALYIAIKLFEPGKLRMSSLIDLSRGYFMAEHIVTMEDSMLQSLKWMVHPPTSFAFAGDFMSLVGGDVGAVRHDVQELSRFMTELSVCDYRFATMKPSSVALASIILALDKNNVHPHHKEEFINHLARLGMVLHGDREVMMCHDYLQEMYEAQDITPNLEDAEPRVDSTSPTGVGEGPDADDESVMECA